jgi:hypothetical protein
MAEFGRRIARLGVLGCLSLVPTAATAQPQYATEIYQDFRAGAPLRPEFRIQGPDHESLTRAEEAGLRIKLPLARETHQAIQVAANFVISGDFEITAGFELLSADMPVAGWGVGVSLDAATTDDLKTFLKIARLMRPESGSVFMAEYWTKGANDWQGPKVATHTQRGQLRLVRDGGMARCQIAEAPGAEFKTIFEKVDFSTDDMRQLRYEATDGNKPGSSLDARFVDLRIRFGKPGAAMAAPPPQVAVSEIRQGEGSRLSLHHDHPRQPPRRVFSLGRRLAGRTGARAGRRSEGVSCRRSDCSHAQREAAKLVGISRGRAMPGPQGAFLPGKSRPASKP